MVRNIRRSYSVPAAPPGTAWELGCDALAVQLQLTNLPTPPGLAADFLPLLLDKPAISQFGLTSSARVRRNVVPQPDKSSCFVFGLGTSLASVWTGACR